MEASTLIRRPTPTRKRSSVRLRGTVARQERPRPLQRSDTEQLDPLRVAVLDRDSGFLLVLAKHVERLGWQHDVLLPTVAIQTITRMPLDALVVDPDILGGRFWGWLERLCEAQPRFRVIVCAGSSTVAERVRALRMGADDWLTKPCHPEELLARIEASVRPGRRHEPREVEALVLGEVEIRRDQYQAFVAGRSLELTRREFEVVDLLLVAGGSALERDFIYERLWGSPRARDDRSIDVFVHKLRRKLATASPGWSYIQTDYGHGYRLVAQPVAQSVAVAV
jgi:DNA-binding response OmpR family regulator